MLTTKDIKKKINKIKALAFGAVLIFGMSQTAFAADAQKATVEIEVKNDVSGNIPNEDETFTFEIIPVDNNAPMPQNSEVTIKGNGKASFGLEYDNIGEYKYIIKEKPGNDANYKYDSKEYNINVAITRNPDGSLTPIMTVIEGADQAKRSSVSFVNDYTKPDKPNETSKTTDPTPPTPTNTTTTITTTTTTTNNTTTYVPVVPKLVVDTTSPDYVNINTDPVPLATLETLIDEETPLAVMVSPKTGDGFNMIMWIALLVCSAGVIVAVISRKLLRERKK